MIILFVSTLNAYVSLSFILAPKLCCSFNSVGESRQKNEKERVSFTPLCVSNMVKKKKEIEIVERLFLFLVSRTESKVVCVNSIYSSFASSRLFSLFFFIVYVWCCLPLYCNTHVSFILRTRIDR